MIYKIIRDGTFMDDEYKIKYLNFMHDWIDFLRTQLQSYGFSTSQTDTQQGLCQRYLNFLKRKISPIPRIILKSQEFSCSDEMKPGLEIVERKILQGTDLTPHISKRIGDLDYDDALLNDWGIYHLHLGTSIDTSGFIARTGPLLFARFDEANAYLINVMPHGSWTNKEMVKVIYRNWPTTIESFRVRGIVDITEDHNEDEIQALRRMGVTYLVKMDNGAILAPIGGGYMSTGLSTDVLRECDYNSKLIRQFEKSIKSGLERLIRYIKEQGLSLPKELEFKLNIIGDQFQAVVKNTRIVIQCRIVDDQMYLRITP